MRACDSERWETAAQLAQLRALKCEYGTRLLFLQAGGLQGCKSNIQPSRSSVGSSDRSTVHIKPINLEKYPLGIN